MATFKVALLALFLAFSATFLSVFSTSSPESHQQQDWLKEAVSEVESSAAYSSSETVEVSYKDLKKVLKKIIKCERHFQNIEACNFPSVIILISFFISLFTRSPLMLKRWESMKCHPAAVQHTNFVSSFFF